MPRWKIAITDRLIVDVERAGQVVHGITNTGKVPLTFYWSKWLAKNS